MKTKKILASIFIYTTAFLITGCDNKPPAPLPEVNAENCKPKKIAQISPKERQKEFASLCFRRSSFIPSTGRTWTTNAARSSK